MVVLLGGSDEDIEQFRQNLPRGLLSYTAAGFGTFRIPIDRLSLARDLLRRVRAEGLTSDCTGETTWTADDLGQGRLCLLMPVVGPRLDESKFVMRQRCPACGGVTYLLAPDPRIDIPTHAQPLPPVFTSESGLTTFVSAAAESELRDAGLMTGAATLPVTANGSPTPAFRALIATEPLGDVVDIKYVSRCAQCRRPLEGGGFFPMYERPAGDEDLYFSDRLGPTNPFASERLARAVDRIVGNPSDAPLSFVGWWPDDQDAARLPDLDGDDASVFDSQPADSSKLTADVEE